MKTVVFVGLVLSAALGASAFAATPEYKIVDRIKVPDGAFDYATFDAATGRVYMPRGAYTTIIDVKTGKPSQLMSGASDHIALVVPGTTLVVLTQRAGTIRIADTVTDKVVAEFQGEKNPNSAAYDAVTKLVFVLNKESGTATIIDPFQRKLVETIPISLNTLEFPVADGAGPEKVAHRLSLLGVDAMGVNHGDGPQLALAMASRMPGNASITSTSRISGPSSRG